MKPLEKGSHLFDDEEEEESQKEGSALIANGTIENLLPTVDGIRYEMQEFIPVSETDDDIKTTESDLALLNNGLAFVNAAFTVVRTIDGLTKLCGTLCKMVETRRKVKKLKFGDDKGIGAKTFEVLE